jgi:osmotically-inducible protein OsmY
VRIVGLDSYALLWQSVNDAGRSARAPEVQAREVVRQITRALHRHANIEASNIHVSIADGKVMPEGTIPTYAERDLVEEPAASRS